MIYVCARFRYTAIESQWISQIPFWLSAGCNERVPDAYGNVLVLNGVAMSGDYNGFCFVVI